MTVRTSLYQSPELRQEMRINPRLYQAMELLYMPLLDLQQHLKQELSENPFLELADPDVDEEVSLEEEEEKAEKADEKEGNKIDWEEILLEGFEPAGGRRAEYEEREYFRPTPVERPGLADHLLEQLHLLSLSDREILLGEEIIGNIDDSGYLACSLEEVVEGINRWIAEERESRGEGDADDLPDPYTVEEAERLLEVIQGFDPPGVGARDTRECILLQLRDQGREDSLEYRIVRDHFPDLIHHRWAEIGRAVGVSAREVQAAADGIAKLDPKPGLRYSATDEEYVIPDLVVEEVDGEYLVFVNDTSLPRLRISRSYQEIARDKKRFTGESKEFIANKLNSANWMIQAIEQRRQTMLKVMNFIVDRQREFFEKGIQYLKPLTLREVAEAIDMHESTVSRVTNEKYVQTPRGVFPLKFFFSSGLATATGEDISARGVRDKIAKLIKEEDPRRPLTDQRIVELLRAEGVQIARRTVAKYRDLLGILPARMRKRL